MDNCFMCNAKLKRKTHYLCKDCYNDSTEYYDDILSKCKDIDKYIIDVLNGKSYSENYKLDYIAAIKYIVNYYTDDELMNLLIKNSIVLENVRALNDIIKEKDNQIEILKDKIDELSISKSSSASRYKNRSIACEDGHIVKSNGEFRIDQFLYKNNIVHAYEKVITLKDGSQIHPDFYIPEIDVYIEYHGVKGSAWYIKMNKYKDNIFKLEQMTVIVISHKQEEQIEKILPVLLNQNGLNKTFK